MLTLNDKLDVLRTAQDYKSLAYALDLQASKLSATIKFCDKNSTYKTYPISKKSGGVRIISEPPDQLKLIQSRLAEILKLVSRGENPVFTQELIFKRISHGSIKRTSIITNSRRHSRSNAILNFDLKDFFPSIHAGRISGYLSTDKRLGFSDFASRQIAYIATFDGSLPQGSPLSPILADLIAGNLDAKLQKICKKERLRYSRYVDDITISTHLDDFPKHLVERYADGSVKIGRSIDRAVNKSGFSINHKKTRVHEYKSRQSCTGMVINSYPNISSTEYRLSRAAFRTLQKTGSFHLRENVYNYKNADILLSRVDRVVYARDLERERKILEGKLIETLSKEDKVNLNDNNEDVVESEHQNQSSAKHKPPADRVLLERLTFFHLFSQPTRPILLCEGSLDHFHIRRAKKITGYVFSGKPKKLSTYDRMRLSELSNRQRELLQIGGGATQLKNFVTTYSKNLNFSNIIHLAKPVICLFDNDNAGREVIQAIKGKYGITIPLNNNGKAETGPFQVYKNLWVLFTPADDEDTTIENCYPKHILDRQINNKKFNANTSIDTNKNYGKNSFANKVALKLVKKKSFAGFLPILDGIESILKGFYN